VKSEGRLLKCGRVEAIGIDSLKGDETRVGEVDVDGYPSTVLLQDRPKRVFVGEWLFAEALLEALT